MEVAGTRVTQRRPAILGTQVSANPTKPVCRDLIYVFSGTASAFPSLGTFVVQWPQIPVTHQPHLGRLNRAPHLIGNQRPQLFFAALL